MSSARRRRRRSEQAIDLAFALTFLVAAVGAVIIVISLLFDTRAALPALGLVLFIVGLLLAFEFGLRPVLRQQRPPLRALLNGISSLGRWAGRMAGARRR